MKQSKCSKSKSNRCMHRFHRGQEENRQALGPWTHNHLLDILFHRCSTRSSTEGTLFLVDLLLYSLLFNCGSRNVIKSEKVFSISIDVRHSFVAVTLDFGNEVVFSIFDRR